MESRWTSLEQVYYDFVLLFELDCSIQLYDYYEVIYKKLEHCETIINHSSQFEYLIERNRAALKMVDE